MPGALEKHTFGCVYEGVSRENWLRVKTPPECSRYAPSYDLDSQTERRGKRREPAEHHKSLLCSLVYRAGRMCNHASCMLWTPQCFLSHDGLYPLKVWPKRDHFSHKLLLSGIWSQGWEKSHTVCKFGDYKLGEFIKLESRTCVQSHAVHWQFTTIVNKLKHRRTRMPASPFDGWSVVGGAMVHVYAIWLTCSIGEQNLSLWTWEHHSLANWINRWRQDDKRLHRLQTCV